MEVSMTYLFSRACRPTRVCAGLLMLLVLTLTAPAARAQGVVGPIVITDVDLENFQIVDNVLMADGTVSGTLAGLPFTTDITNFALQLIPRSEERRVGKECRCR